MEVSKPKFFNYYLLTINNFNIKDALKILV